MTDLIALAASVAYLLNMLVQAVGIGSAIYLAFSHSLSSGLLLVMVLGGLHFILAKVTQSLVLAHLKTFNTEEKLRDLERQAYEKGQMLGAISSFVYCALAAAAIWYFLNA